MGNAAPSPTPLGPKAKGTAATPSPHTVTSYIPPMLRPDLLLQPTPKGLYCPPGDFYLDPVRGAVDRAVISHGHSDHARGGRMTFTGDYKRRFDPTCARFEPVNGTHVFISEATFALPVFRHPETGHEIDRLLQSLQQFPERSHCVGAYSLIAARSSLPRPAVSKANGPRTSPTPSSRSRPAG